ncbi:MAG: DUF106 domain-containing protein [Candidatus Aenigmarchaeota archaeon]|nr:DUF106 domain-containing protein [Candidatus Aenigmarchaeota archaeon]
MVASVLVVTLFAICTSFVLTLPYKFLMNQEQAKSLRAHITEMNAKVREEQKKKNTEQTTKLLNEMMSEQGKLMHMTTRPMVVTLLLVLLILPFFSPLFVKDATLTENQTALSMGGANILVQKNGTLASVEIEGSAAFSLNAGETQIKQISSKRYFVTYKPEQSFLFMHTPSKVEVEEIIAKMVVPLPFVGENAGWLAWYIIITLPTNLLFRKLLNIQV